MTSPLVHLVDDDAAIRDALVWLLQSRGIAARAWPSAEAFLADYSENMSGCLVLDIRMTGMTGAKLFEALLGRGCILPTLFLTGHGDVPLAVKMLKLGAFDFLEKPCNDEEFLGRIEEALHRDRKKRSHAAGRQQVEARLATLTEREREVMACILAGKLNKVIADDLQIAMRTVEVHRARIFEKMCVRSAVELAQLLADSR